MPRFPDPPRDDVVALRPWADGDMDFLVAAGNDPLVARFTRLPSPYTRADARAWVTSARWLLELGRAAHLALADATTDEPLGAAGLVEVDRRAGRGEAGYWLAPAARGRGLATRAVGLLTDWAHGPLGLPRVVMRIDAANDRSQRVATRAGFVRESGRNSPSLLVYTHPRAD